MAKNAVGSYNGWDERSVRTHRREVGLRGEEIAEAEQAFARVIVELEQGEWHLVEWARDLGISEDEMFIEVDRRLHQPVAA